MLNQCDYDPRELSGQPIGMFHCPKCSEMVVAGLPHPPPDMDSDGDLCISLYCGHRREYHTPKCAFSACTCEAFEEAPTAEEADAYLRGLGVIKKCEVCGQDASLTNDFVTHLMKRYTALHAAAEQMRDALELAQKVCHERFCDRHPMGQSEVCKVASDALTPVRFKQEA